MSYQRRGNLLVPKEKPTLLAICQDSAKLVYGSGRIVSTLVFPQQYLLGFFTEEARSILGGLGHSASEFHASKLKQGNLSSYKRFLALTMDGIHRVTDASNIESKVHIFGSDAHEGSAIQDMVDFIDEVWDNEESRYPEEFLRELARHVHWYAAYGSNIFPERYNAELHVYIDDEGLLSEQLESIRSYRLNGNAVLMTGKEFIRRIFEAIRKQAPSFRTIPPIKHWCYLDSSDNFGIQAADLLSNLFQGAIKYELGDRSKASKIRRALISDLTDFRLPDELRNSVVLDQLPDGQLGLKSTKHDLFAHFTLTTES